MKQLFPILLAILVASCRTAPVKVTDLPVFIPKKMLSLYPPGMLPRLVVTESFANGESIEMAAVVPTITPAPSRIVKGARVYGTNWFPNIGLIFPTNHSLIVVSNSCDLARWTCWTWITNAVAGQTNWIGWCPCTDQFHFFQPCEVR